MFKVITKKEEFLENPTLEMNEKEIANAKTDTIKLFGNTWKMYADEWKHHIHIKCTDVCDANCPFCIEKTERRNPQEPMQMLTSTEKILDALASQNQLRTVSITGGEPTMFVQFERLMEIIEKFRDKITLLSINTNGRYLNRIPSTYNGWLDISKHAIDDKDIFKRNFLLTPELLKEFRKTHKDTKIRFQCVLGTTDKMTSVDNILDFIKYYKDVVDDFSFRNLIIENDETKISNLLLDFRKMLFDKGEFISQCIQDYYVYEEYEILGTKVTLSWSNMKELKNYNESHNFNFLEEIIVHPDGIIAGSWNKRSLIIYEPEKYCSNKNYSFCRGIGCTHHCNRFYDYLNVEDMIYQNNLIDNCGRLTELGKKLIAKIKEISRTIVDEC